MATRRVALRLLSEADLRTIYEWRNRPSFRFYIMGYDDVASYEEFCEQMHRFGLTRPYRYMVESCDTGRPIGFAYARDHSEDGSSCFLNVYIEDAYIGLGYGVDVFVLMASFLFHSAAVRRIALEVFSYNARSLSALRGAKVRELASTGKYREHEGKNYLIHEFEISEADLPAIDAMLARLSATRSTSATPSRSP